MCRNCRDFVKFLIYLVSLLLLGLGTALAAAAGYTAFNRNSALHNVIVSVHLPGTMTGIYIMFAVGIIIALVAIFGCVATSSENRLMLWLTFFFILLLFIMQMVGVILCFYKYNVVQKHLTTIVKDSVTMQKSKSLTVSFEAKLLRLAIGSLESTNKCCGLNGPQDYGKHVPNTCRPTRKKTSSVKGDAAPEAAIGELGNGAVETEKLGVSGTATSPTLLSSKTTTTTSTTTTSPAAISKSSTTTTTASTTTTPKPATTSSSTTFTTSTTKLTTTTEPAPAPRSTSTSAAAFSPSTTAALATKASTTTTTAPRTTTAALIKTTTLAKKTKAKKVLPAPYSTGCLQRFAPVIYAAGGIGIALLVSEFVLLLLIGCLLCEVGKEYESLA